MAKETGRVLTRWYGDIKRVLGLPWNRVTQDIDRWRSLREAYSGCNKVKEVEHIEDALQYVKANVLALYNKRPEFRTFQNAKLP